MKPSERIGQLVQPTLSQIEESIRSGAVGRHYPAALSDAEWENVKANPAVQILILDAMVTALIGYLDETASTQKGAPRPTPEEMQAVSLQVRADYRAAVQEAKQVGRELDRYSEARAIDPERLPGQPVVAGTRLTVAQLVAELAEGRSIDEVATAMGLNRTDLAVALWSAANPSSQTHTLTTAGYDQARLDLYQALHSTMGWTALSSLDDTAASILDRIHELEQRLALISELASNPPPHLEAALAQLEAVAAVSQDGDAATQATLKWLPLAHQLGEAQRHQERLEALIRAADDMRSWYDKQMGPEGPEDTYDRLRAGIQLDSKESPSNPLALAWDEGHEAKAKAVREGSTADTSQQNPYR